MKFEINVKNKVRPEKLAVVKQLNVVLGVGLAIAKHEIADKIFELLSNGAESASIIVDSEVTAMKPLFSIQENIPLYENHELGITIKLVKDPKELNLCELLKDCAGKTFYMPLFGVVVLDYARVSPGGNGVLSFTVDNEKVLVLGSDGKYCDNGELSVFPSKEQRDWSLFVPPWMPKEGERVWVRDDINDLWVGRYFVKMNENTKEFDCIPDNKKQWIPTPYKICVPFEPIPW